MHMKAKIDKGYMWLLWTLWAILDTDDLYSNKVPPDPLNKGSNHNRWPQDDQSQEMPSEHETLWIMFLGLIGLVKQQISGY